MKKIRHILFIFYFLFFTSRCFSQYFQQEVNYKINVSLEDVSHELNASESIEYINNSPNTLSEIYFHLWANAYKDNSSALSKQLVENGKTILYFADDKMRGYIDQLDFKVNDKPVKLIYPPKDEFALANDSLNIDICRLILNEPLESGEKIIITTPFHVKIPSAKFSRMGHIGQAYFISQWYPKPAVYDQFGWHPIPYLDQGEFYSEFGSFEVNITLPKNYVVGATGDLQNEEEINWLNKNAEETKAISTFESSMSFPKSDSETKTISYKQSRVHDFAWIADKRFHVLKSEVELPHTKNKVTTWAMFTNAQAKWWTKAPEYIDSVLYYYSLWNGDYAYKNCTAVDGTIAAGGGMEYPNVTIIGRASDEFNLEDVIVHEVGHNWFYGMLGSNERDHAWMDEGINSFNELRYIYTKYPEDKTNGMSDISGLGKTGKIIGADKINFKDAFNLEYLAMARIHHDQPDDITSANFTELNYGIVVYRKTALLFDYLKSYLGDSLFDECMQNYFDAWKFRHPYPDDLKKVFENKTEKNLDWFFVDLLKTNKKIDYKISSIRPLRGENILNPVAHSYGITITNSGEITAPFSYSIMKDGEVISKRWMEGFSGKQNIQVTCNNCDEIKIDSQHEMPDMNEKNNTIRTSGLLKNTEPFQFSFLGKIENPDRTQIFYTPVIGWNNYNKTMAGIALYNKFLPNKNFEYVFMPMYSCGTKNLAGTGNISYTYYPGKTFLHNINISASGNHYSFDRLNFQQTSNSFFKSDMKFTTLPVEFTFTFRKKSERSPVLKSLTLRNINVWQDELIFSNESLSKTNTYLYFHQTVFNWENKRTFDPFGFSVTLESGKKYMKSNLEFNYKFSYPDIRKGVDVRLFAGAFIYNNEQERNYNYRMSAWTGYQDYLFDDIYLGRSEGDGIFSRQTYIHDGGFKIFSPVGQSNKWVTSMNIMIDAPVKLPLRLFADIGTYSGAKDAFEGSQAVMYDGGVCVYLIKNVAEVYFPLFKSTDIKQALEANDVKYKEQIRFVLNFKLMNPFRVRDNLLNNN